VEDQLAAHQKTNWKIKVAHGAAAIPEFVQAPPCAATGAIYSTNCKLSDEGWDRGTRISMTPLWKKVVTAAN